MDKNEVRRIANKFLKLLKEKKYDVYEAYLFGSYVNGIPTEDSDIDLAIILDKIKDRFDTRIELMQLGSKVNLLLEPHPFEKKDLKSVSPLLSNVLKNGIKLQF